MIATPDYVAPEDRYRLACDLARLLSRSAETAWRLQQGELLAASYEGVARCMATFSSTRGSFSHWARRCIRSRIGCQLRKMRQQRRQTQALCATPDDDSAAPADIQCLERADMVRWLLDNMPPCQRQALVMHAVDGLSYAEIGAALSISTSAAGSLVRRSLASARRLVQHEEGL